MPSSQRSKSSNRRQKHGPLADDLVATGPLRTKSKKRKARTEDDTNGAKNNNYIDSRASRKILKIGQELEEEDQAETKAAQPNPAFAFESRFGGHSEQESEEEIDERKYDDDEAWGSDEDDAAMGGDLDPKDLDLFNKFNPTNGHHDPVSHPAPSDPDEENPSTNLADLILEKIAAHEAIQERGPIIQGGGHPDDAIEFPPKVVEVYTKIGHLLSRYRSGPLPKPFKILPSLPQHPTLLAITRPSSWTPQACYAATRIFISANSTIGQAYLREVILDRVHADIYETKKLNVHLYNSLRKSLYRPAAFFKGFLFPLVEGGTCTLREAHIVSSVLVKSSVPVLHSAAALLRLTEIAAELTTSRDVEAAGSVNVFIKVLLEKKYALPYRVVDGCVFHFLRYRAVRFDGDEDRDGGGEGIDGGAGAGGKGGGRNANPNGNRRGKKEQEGGKLPVIWHQCLLAFAQRYRNDITEDQREALLDLLILKGHKDIGPEVRRELLLGRGRGVPIPEEMRMDGDDTMMMVD